MKKSMSPEKNALGSGEISLPPKNITVISLKYWKRVSRRRNALGPFQNARELPAQTRDRYPEHRAPYLAILKRLVSRGSYCAQNFNRDAII